MVEDKLQLKIVRSPIYISFTIIYRTENRAKYKILSNNCLITHCQSFEFCVMSCERLCYELHKFLMCGNHICMASKDSGK